MIGSNLIGFGHSDLRAVGIVVANLSNFAGLMMRVFVPLIVVVDFALQSSLLCKFVV